MRRTLRNNSLSIALFVMFALSLGGQFFTGHREYNEDRRKMAIAPVPLLDYCKSGHFIEATFENWESEFLQMGMFVVLTVWLFQKGSPESRDPDKDEEDVDADPRDYRGHPGVPWPVRRGGWMLKLYSNSLGLAFGLLFLASVLLHAAGGARVQTEEDQREGKPPTGMVEYMGTSRFWFESFQNWQSEFLSIGVMVVLSVYLRQRGSPESKPVPVPNDATELDELDDEAGSAPPRIPELASR